MSAFVEPERLQLPPVPVRAERRPFPWIAVAAPLVMAGVMSAVTGNPAMAWFGLFAPVIALAGIADGVLGGRRARRRERVRYLSRLEALRTVVADAHDRERRAAWRTHPRALDLFLAEAVTLWDLDEPASVTLGCGRGPSALRPAGADTPPADAEAAASLHSLLEEAALVDDLPVPVRVADGLGLAGAPVLTRAVARGLVLQLASRIPPERLAVRVPPTAEWAWAGALPHVRSQASARLWLCEHDESPPPDGAIVLALAERTPLLPPRLGAVFEVADAVDGRIVHGGARSAVVPELVGIEQAAAHAARLAEFAARRGGAGLVGAVEFADLPVADTGAGLRAVVGAGRHGPVTLDLVADGPHALVAGTTGSGKSELIVTWIAGLAAAHSVGAFTFLLVDFKGGATGLDIAALPHCVGVVTDLDTSAADRALHSLTAELRRREALLALLGAREIAEAGAALARLVIVVDEYAALLTRAPRFHDLFADIAARGRSLGMHLVLGTQRPSGVVREAVLANCGIRICLRVNDAGDSSAVVGVPDAARIDSTAPGRCLLSASGAPIDELQIARTTAADVAAIAARTVAAPVHRPWLEPLPERLDRTHAALRHDGPGIVLGLVDDPDHQDQRAATWLAETDGNLLVAGSARSGVSTALGAVAEQWPGCLLPSTDPEAVWDALEEAEASGSGIVVDDWDAVAARYSLDHRQHALDRLGRLLRRGGVGVGTRRPAQLGGLVGLFGSVLALRMDDRAEYLAAGAEPALWATGLPPGRGTWRGSRIQVALPGRGRMPAPARVHRIPEHGPLAVVRSATASERDWGRELIRIDGAPSSGLRVDEGSAVALVGDADAWARAAGLLQTLRAAGVPVVFDSVGTAEVRTLGRIAAVPPPLASPAHAWMVGAAGLQRVRLPDQAMAEATSSASSELAAATPAL